MKNQYRVQNLNSTDSDSYFENDMIKILSEDEIEQIQEWIEDALIYNEGWELLEGAFADARIESVNEISDDRIRIIGHIDFGRNDWGSKSFQTTKSFSYTMYRNVAGHFAFDSPNI